MIMSLRKRIQNKQLTIGSWLTIGHPAVAEIMSKAGFDWLAIDMEHSPLTVSQCQELIRVIDLCGVVPLVRVGANEPLLIKRAMDAGAHGVIVPMVNSAAEAQAAVTAVKYPPQGKRGVGLARAQGYGTAFQTYQSWNKKESIVIVQIEDIRAVENLEKIFSVDGVDAFMVGPYDLSASLGISGQFGHPKMLSAMAKIKEMAKKTGVPAGYHVVSSDPRLVKKKIKEGYTFVAFGVDFLFLGNNCREGLKCLKK
ncbi:MAG: 2,4-dihydroxyhept-2-ene-1,7-dioic acid aldolase [Candidatus Omnitrophica bacterium]|nr:2,4-dihydroxyhept-2-ene-1,7-dioic acid aldolase [Candidatus Omnitrophota bacterium]